MARKHREQGQDQDELCRCTASDRAMQLMFADGPSCLCCMACGGSIDVHTLKLPPEVVDDVLSWEALYGAIYLLWLNHEYEAWANLELSSVNSHVNQCGMALCRELNRTARCYYFVATDCPSWDTKLILTHCPGCGDRLERRSTRPPQLVCDKDSLVLEAE